jgi:hypothetical protein
MLLFVLAHTRDLTSDRPTRSRGQNRFRHHHNKTSDPKYRDRIELRIPVDDKTDELIELQKKRALNDHETQKRKATTGKGGGDVWTTDNN